MKQLMFTEPGRCRWQEIPDPEPPGPGQALVRPIAVACCDLDVAVAQGRAPLPPGYAVGHEGIGEVIAIGDEVTSVAVGDRVVVPFQINCGACRTCRRGRTGSCESVPGRAMYGLGSIAGLDGGGFLADAVLVPYADAMLVPVLPEVDPVAVASLSDNIPDGWRTVGPYRDQLDAADPADRRMLVVGGLSIGLYAAAFGVAYGARIDYVDTDAHRLAAAEKLGAIPHDRPAPDSAWDPYPLTANTSADPALLAAALRATWPGGTCTDTGIYFGATVDVPMFEMYSRGVRLVTARADARADIPAVLDILAAGHTLAPVVDRTVAWGEAADIWPTMTTKVVFVR
ncbi:zinc-dependent alcohol dehydrogenase [Nocardia sp. NPDC003482]